MAKISKQNNPTKFLYFERLSIQSYRLSKHYYSEREILPLPCSRYAPPNFEGLLELTEETFAMLHLKFHIYFIVVQIRLKTEPKF